MSVQIFIYLSDVMSVDSLKQLKFVFVLAQTLLLLLLCVYLLWGGLSRFVGVTLLDSLSTLKKLWKKLLFLLRCYRKMLSASVVAIVSIVAIVSGCLLPARVVN